MVFCWVLLVLNNPSREIQRCQVPRDMDIQILAEQFYEYSLAIKGYTKDTVRRYKFVIHAFCKSTDMYVLEDISEAKIREFFYTGRTMRNWSVPTYITYRVSLLVFFRWCVRQGLMKVNPVDAIEVPKAEKRLPKGITKQKALRLLDIIHNYPYEISFLRYRNHAIFATFLFAGLRKQELLNLKYTDVDIENLTLFIRFGKGNKDRVVPISSTLAQTLKRYLESRRKYGKTCPEFFAASNGNHGYSNKGLKYLVMQLREAAGMDFTVHQLRHTFATLMLEGGCDIYSLSKMMGHSDIKTTTIYLSVSTEHLRSQIIKHPMNNTGAFR